VIGSFQVFEVSYVMISELIMCFVRRLEKGEVRSKV
jgi:hypothetical protein